MCSKVEAEFRRFTFAHLGGFSLYDGWIGWVSFFPLADGCSTKIQASNDSSIIVKSRSFLGKVFIVLLQKTGLILDESQTPDLIALALC